MLWLLLLIGLSDPPTVRLDEPPTVKLGHDPIWFTDYSAACAERDRTGKPVLILFTDPVNCLPCKALEAGAMSDDRVKEVLEGYVCLRCDVGSTDGRTWATVFGVQSWPTMMVYRDGKHAGATTGDVCPAGLVEFLKPPVVSREKVPVRPSAGRMGIAYNPSHVCTTCGHSEYRIDPGSMQANGRHTHTCRRDGTTWYH